MIDKNSMALGESTRTHWVWSIAILLAFTSNAWSGTLGVSEAQTNLSKAYNDYYRALEKSPTQSPSEAAKFSREIINPASEALGHAVANQTRKTMGIALSAPGPAISAPGVSISPGSDVRASKDTPGNPVNQDRSGAQVKSTATTSTPGHAVKPEATHAPEIVLDGSNVPRELEFPGPQKH